MTITIYDPDKNEIIKDGVKATEDFDAEVRADLEKEDSDEDLNEVIKEHTVKIVGVEVRSDDEEESEED
mgnify:CR=1 FL=1